MPKDGALTAFVLRIGRSAAAGLTLDDATVSRRHAVLLRDDTARGSSTTARSTARPASLRGWANCGW